MTRLQVVLSLFVFVVLVAPGAANATGTLDQQQTSEETAYAVSGPGFAPSSNAQTFTAGLSGQLDEVELWLLEDGTGLLPLEVQIRTVAPGGEPSTTVLASASVPASSLPPCCTGAFVPITFNSPATVKAGIKYAIVAYTLSPDGLYEWGGTRADVYAGGLRWNTGASPPVTWASVVVNDMTFKTYVTVPTTKHPTETTVSCEPKSVVAGQPTKCTATVTDTATSGQTTPTGTVSFKTSGAGSFNSASCKLSTVSASSASCAVTYTPGSTPANPVRTDTITATYEGDTTHESSKGMTTVPVISPTALARGSFVIGDKNAVVGKGVTFSDVEWWGSNWWKLNSLSGGPAPPAFKGFAESSSSPPACGESWTTNTGNNSGPPPTVPEYMEVIAASKITQSGSTIKGNTPKLAVVKTNPGYLPDPGHKGTGKVVAVIECQ
jgi:hypothetical protein